MVFFFAGSIEWGERGVRVGVDSAEAAEQARFAIELYGIGALNLLVSIAFLIRRSGWAWWLVLGCKWGSSFGTGRGSAHRSGLVLLQQSPAVDLVSAVHIPNGAGQAEAAR